MADTQTHAAAEDVVMDGTSAPAEGTGAQSTPGGRLHLKRSHPDGAAADDAPSSSGAHSSPVGAAAKRPRGRPKAAKNSRRSNAHAGDDDGAYHGAPGRKSASLGPSADAPVPPEGVSVRGMEGGRAAKVESRNRNLALALALQGAPPDPKGKGKAVVHGGENRSVPNEDFCQVCNGKGRFICCDGCPHSFHMTCLDPPMDDATVPDKDSMWFCKDCQLAKGHVKPPPPPSTIFGQLMTQLDEQPPSQFQLPNEVKAYFKGVAVAPNGAYVDGDRLRPMKADRKGFVEDRDLHRLKDSKGGDVLCYKCHGSAAPREGASELRPARLGGQIGVEVSRWRKIISCDYCTLHWHFDCLDPPMTAVPPVTHKWMCPNHAEHVMPKVRIPKQGAILVDVQGPGEFNNGHVEILPALEPERVRYEDVVLSNKRYRVPETSIIVDFWSKVLGRPRPIKVNKGKAAVPPARGKAHVSRSVSPLTSLDSEDSDDDSDADSNASSELSSVASEAGDAELVSEVPDSFAQLIDAFILTPADAPPPTPVAPAPAASPAGGRKIILRVSRSTGSTSSGSPPKLSRQSLAPPPETNGVQPQPCPQQPAGQLHAPAMNGQAPAGLSADLTSADEETQMRAIRDLINAKGKDKLLEFLQQS